MTASWPDSIQVLRNVDLRQGHVKLDPGRAKKGGGAGDAACRCLERECPCATRVPESKDSSDFISPRLGVTLSRRRFQVRGSFRLSSRSHRGYTPYPTGYPPLVSLPLIYRSGRRGFDPPRV